MYRDYAAIHQIVAPVAFRTKLLDLAHDIPAAAHLGINKTQELSQRHCSRPSTTGDSKIACPTVDVCQKLGNDGIPAVAPLQSIPTVSQSFCQVTKNSVSILFVFLLVCLFVGSLVCHPVRCDDESIPMTGFVTHFGFFCWKFMAFGPQCSGNVQSFGLQTHSRL